MTMHTVPSNVYRANVMHGRTVLNIWSLPDFRIV